MILNKAVFLDRDGVLTVEKGHITRIEDLEIFPYARECVDMIHKKGYLAIVITNQSGVARGLFTEDTLKAMNQVLIRETGVDAVYYCPHYPEGTVPEYSIKCGCRKPNTGLVTQAVKDHNITLVGSYMVGDRASDIILGSNAGLTTVLVESGYGTDRLESPVAPDHVFADLRGFVNTL